MIAVVVSNLLYLGVAVVVAVLGALIVVLRQRKPRSVEANMASFNKGLRALAPDDEADRPAARPSWGGAHRPVLVSSEPSDASDPSDDGEGEDGEAEPAEVPPAEVQPEASSEEVPVGDEAPELIAPVELATRQRSNAEQALPIEEAGTG